MTPPDRQMSHNGVHENGLTARRLDRETLRLLGSGHHADVYLLHDGTTVSKRYRAIATRTAVEMAEYEFAMLGDVRAALAEIPGVRSPQPIALRAEAGHVEMSYCTGSTLSELAKTGVGIDSSSVESIMCALFRSISKLATNGSLTFDISPHNVLYEPASGDITLIDFSEHPFLDRLPRGQNAHELAVGNFIATALALSLHRSNILNHRMGTRLRSMSARLLAFGIEHGNVRTSRIVRGCWHHLREANAKRSIRQRVWFSSIGAILFLASVAHTIVRANRIRRSRRTDDAS